MAGKTLIGGTAYTIKGGKTRVGGTDYTVKGGKTLIGGTARSITFGRIPSTYQEVEFLQGTGFQYIDTNLKLFTTDIVECDFADYNISTGSATQTKLFGCYGYEDSTLNAKSLWFGNNSANNTRLNYYNNQKSVLCSPTNNPYTGLVVVNQNNVTLNGAVIGTLSGQITEVECFHSAYLFAAYVQAGSSTDIFPSKVKIKRYTVKNKNGVLRQNFVPCYRKSDNKAGMYDTVSGGFYTNAGSGNFTVGGNV